MVVDSRAAPTRRPENSSAKAPASSSSARSPGCCSSSTRARAPRTRASRRQLVDDDPAAQASDRTADPPHRFGDTGSGAAGRQRRTGSDRGRGCRGDPAAPEPPRRGRSAGASAPSAPSRRRNSRPDDATKLAEPLGDPPAHAIPLGQGQRIARCMPSPLCRARRRDLTIATGRRARRDSGPRRRLCPSPTTAQADARCVRLSNEKGPQSVPRLPRPLEGPPHSLVGASCS